MPTNETAPQSSNRPPRTWPWLIAGIALTGCSIAIGQYTNTAEALMLDMNGVRVEGTLETMGENRQVLRYSDSDGAIYRAEHKPALGSNPQPGPIDIVYSPDDHRMAQPAGASWLRAAITLTLFTVGLSSILIARNRLRSFAIQRGKSGAS